jgi:hypothetical protein
VRRRSCRRPGLSSEEVVDAYAERAGHGREGVEAWALPTGLIGGNLAVRTVDAGGELGTAEARSEAGLTETLGGEVAAGHEYTSGGRPMVV